MPVHTSSLSFRATAIALALLSTVLLSACAPDPPTVLLEIDRTRTDVFGERGVFGAYLHTRTFRVRVDEAVETDVIVPLASRTSFPPVLLLPGGAVDTERYRWLGAHIASRGFTVIAPHHALPILFEQGNIYDVFQAVRAVAQDPDDPLYRAVTPDAPAFVLGHSLGGVSAAKVWASQPNDTTHLVLICSTTDTSDDYSTRPVVFGNERILSLIGTADERVLEETAREGIKTFTVPLTFAAVEGMNHYQVVEDPTESELADDGVPTIDEERARFLTTFLIDSMLADFVGQKSPLEDPESWPEGLLTVAR